MKLIKEITPAIVTAVICCLIGLSLSYHRDYKELLSLYEIQAEQLDNYYKADLLGVYSTEWEDF